MQSITEYLKYLKPDVLINTLLDQFGVYVYIALFLIVFAETGLAVGFFLPGDSLLFVAGLMAATYPDKLNVVVLLVSLFLAGVLGDAVGYYTGKKTGKTIFNRPKSFIFRPEYLEKAHKFYEKHGGKTIIIARFVPIVRTFAPIVAGAADMSYRKFVVFNVVGGFLWVFSMILSGYFLGGLIEKAFGIKLEEHIEKVVIVVVLLSILPPLIEWWRSRRERSRGAQSSNSASGDALEKSEI
jgi:membrane-associated protein